MSVTFFNHDLLRYTDLKINPKAEYFVYYQMKAWMLHLLFVVGFIKAHGQGTINASSGKITGQSKEIDFVFGGEIINAISNNSFSIIPSSIPVNESLITEIMLRSNEEQVIYPNPFVNTLFINLNSIQRVEILDGRGIIVKSALFKSGELDVHDLPQGLYILRIYDDGNSNTIKVVKHEIR